MTKKIHDEKMRGKPFSYIIDDDFTFEVVEDVESDSSSALQELENSVKKPPLDCASVANDNDFCDDSDEEKLVINEEKEKRKRGNFCCNKCSYVTTQKHRLDMHMEAHSTQDKTYSCAKCNFITLTFPALTAHKARCGTLKNQYRCTECSLSFSKMVGLRRHKRRNHAENPVYSCPKCNFRTDRWSLVDKHKNKHQTKTLRCDECEFQTSSKMDLVKHNRNQHPIVCEYCKYTTGDKKRFEEHKQKHLVKKVKMYQCDLCGYEGKTTQLVQRHRAAIHLKETVLVEENREEKIEN